MTLIASATNPQVFFMSLGQQKNVTRGSPEEMYTKLKTYLCEAAKKRLEKNKITKK